MRGTVLDLVAMRVRRDGVLSAALWLSRACRVFGVNPLTLESRDPLLRFVATLAFYLCRYRSRVAVIVYDGSGVRVPVAGEACLVTVLERLGVRVDYAVVGRLAREGAEAGDVLGVVARYAGRSVEDVRMALEEATASIPVDYGVRRRIVLHLCRRP